MGKRNLDKLNCENVGNCIRNEIIPKILTFLNNVTMIHNTLSQNNFLKLFGLKNICYSTVWRWMCHFGFSYDERKKCYFSDKHKNSENIEFRKKITNEYFK